MKIVRKISLKNGLKRYIEPSSAYPKLTQTSYHQANQRNITVNQQLHKYGVRPNFFQWKFTLSLILGGIFAVTSTIYLNQLYRNEKDTIYRYRQHQVEHTSLKLRLRIALFKFLQFNETNLFLSSIFSTKQEMGKKVLSPFTQGFLRHGQYTHLMKNKDRKFDFLDIGILQKFPYPKLVQQLE